MMLFNRIPKRRRYFLRFLANVYEQLMVEFEREHQENGLTKKELAERLGQHPSTLTRLFKGDRDMHLETLYNISYEMGCEVRLDISKSAKITLIGCGLDRAVNAETKSDNVFILPPVDAASVA